MRSIDADLLTLGSGTLRVSRKNIARFAPLAIATVVVGLGAYFVGYTAISDMQRSHAEYVAKSFSDYLVEEVGDLEQMILGRHTPEVVAAIIGAVKPVGTVYEFRLFDQNGVLRGDSSMFARGLTVGRNVEGRSSTAVSVLSTGRSHFKMHEGDGVDTPRYYSDITVPLLDGKRTIGVLSVLSDETETWPGLFDQFRTVLLQVLALVAVAFGIPGMLYLRKTGQLAKTARTLRLTAQYDELTGCLNRATFTRIVRDLLDGSVDKGLSVAVHFIDLDRFKDVNESMGHAAGDELLKQAAQRLRKLMGTRERIARLGADEFAICQPHYEHSSQVVAELATDIARAMAKPFEINGKKVLCGASVGYSRYPRDGATVDELFHAADLALHNAKTRCRGKALSFDPGMESERQLRTSIEARLRTSLVNSEFEINFQPLYDTATDKLKGFEALLRMTDNDGKPISPAEFIPIAESTGLIHDIGLWVLREACRMAKQWPADLSVAVNLSPAQFAAGDMATMVRDVLVWSGMDPKRLELEITESVLITDTETVLKELMAIKALGVSIALDDFGTGFSSLGYLWRFPFDKLKVDKSFMAEIAVEGSKSREILSSIIALGKVLDLKVTAEGVETEEQALVLRELRCDLVQGYLFGRPMRAIDVAATIMRGVSGKWPAPVQIDTYRKDKRGAA
jgi:diguanylate cyclase (GGDEF)-like protein